ncbi:MAG TPA: nucleotidyltransferase domain-containing protein [Candidatus Sulfotelmatobacter sp.]|nr:nucleotidyltransferase domain-containing protein [Candidatus Sulfotelmatobacter sp.]
MDETLRALKDQIVKIVRQHLKIAHYKVFFFGSRVGGSPGQRSDLDIGLESREKLPAGAVLELKEKLDELPTLLKLDLVDFNEVDGDFRQVALKNIEVIYEQ